MQQTLEAMSIPQIAIRSFTLYFRMFPALLGMLGLLLIIPIVLVVVGGALAAANLAPLALLFFLVGFLASYAAFFYFYAATTIAVSLRLTGARARIWQILRRLSGKLAIQIIGTALLAGLAIVGGVILLIIPGVLFFVWFVLAIPVVVLERVAYRDALRRSRELSRGHGWRILGAFLVYLLIIFVVFFVIGIFAGVAGLSQQEITVLVNIGSILLNPVGVIFPVLLYYDIRVRKEGLKLIEIGEVA